MLGGREERRAARLVPISPEAMGEVLRTNNGYRSALPIIIEGGATLNEPSDRALAEVLEIDLPRPAHSGWWRQ